MPRLAPPPARQIGKIGRVVKRQAAHHMSLLVIPNQRVGVAGRGNEQLALRRQRHRHGMLLDEGDAPDLLSLGRDLLDLIVGTAQDKETIVAVDHTDRLGHLYLRLIRFGLRE